MCGHVDLGEQKDLKFYTGKGEGNPSKRSVMAGNPGSMMPVVTDALPDKVQQYRWGLLTLDDNHIHSKNKHARIESLTHVPMWAELVGKKHCVVRVQAYFEHSAIDHKTYKIERVDGQPMYIAGLWDIWFDIKSGMFLPTFVMITTKPAQNISEIHDRMPALIERSDVKYWLNTAYKGTQRISFLMRYRYPSEILSITEKK